MKKILKYIKQPKKIILYLMNKGFFNWLDDETYLKIKYRLIMKKKLDISNPKTFNEKIQWLKIHDRKDIYTTMVDKYEAKKYISNIIGDDYIVPTLGIYDSFDEIDFEKLPNEFVIKPTHTSGNVYICKNKNEINYKKLKRIIRKWLRRKYYYTHREWPYKNIKPRIIIEKYMSDEEQKELIDYKLFCFNTIPKLTLVCSERFSSDNMCETFFDENWNVLDITEGNHRVDKNIKKPNNYEEMKEIAKKLSEDTLFTRIDFYEINGKIYFGEITFYPNSGYEKFEPKEYDKILGDWIKLERNKGENINEN